MPAALLTIAGFDPSNGAGITADLQVFAAHGYFGVSAITALTVQSTQGVVAVEPVSRTILRQTLECLVADVAPSGIKIGMLANRETAEEVSLFLEAFGLNNSHIPVVFDPVLGPTTGDGFLSQDGIVAVRTALLGRVSWVTPNWTELALLAQMPVSSFDQAEAAMHALGRRFPNLNIVATGGDCAIPTDLLRTSSGEIQPLPGTRVATTSTHGTGCAFSSALLCRLARGEAPLDAVVAAKQYVEGALRHAPGIGRGHGPMGLLWPLLQTDTDSLTSDL